MFSAVALWTLQFQQHREPSINQITFTAGLTIDPALSPDGKLVAYASDRADGRNLNIWVQQLTPGGSAVQLTHEDADTRQPSFSPDGAQVVFHCARDGGGICAIPAIGGEIVRLSAQGVAPRISPDGKLIAFQVGYSLTSIVTGSTVGHSFVMPASGGPARPVGTDLRTASGPVWSPDSRHLLVYEYGGESSADWALVPTEGGPSRRTGLFAALKRQGISVGFNRVPQLSDWQRGFVLFSAFYGDTTNAWRIPVSANGTPRGEAQRLTSGTAIEASPRLSAAGTLLYESLSSLNAIWGMPLDAGQGLVHGELTRLTAGPFDIMPSLSLDGRWLAFTTARGKKAASQNARVALKDLNAGTETVIPEAATPEAHPFISSDGSLLAINRLLNPPDWDGVRIVQREHLATLRSPNIRGVRDWSHDNRRLLHQTPQGEIRCFDLVSGKDVFRVSNAKYFLYQAKFAPGDRFVALEAVDQFGYGINSRIFIVPFRENSPVAADDWIAIDHAGSWDDKPRWSPDGSLLYFVSDRDGHLCLWAQRLHAESKRMLGTPFPVRHFHGAGFGMQNVGLGLLEIDIAHDKVVFGIGEVTGNIWSVRGP